MLLDKFNIFDFLVIAMGAYLLVAFVWRKLEVKYYGEVKPNHWHIAYTILVSLLYAYAFTTVPALEVFGILSLLLIKIYIYIWVLKTVIERYEFEKRNEKLIDINKGLIKDCDELKIINYKTKQHYNELLKVLEKELK